MCCRSGAQRPVYGDSYRPDIVWAGVGSGASGALPTLMEPSGGMAYMSHVFAEIAAENMLAASQDRPMTTWALPSMAMLVASMEAWTGERLAWPIKPDRVDEATKERYRRLIYDGSLRDKFAALRRLGTEEAGPSLAADEDAR